MKILKIYEKNKKKYYGRSNEKDIMKMLGLIDNNFVKNSKEYNILSLSNYQIILIHLKFAKGITHITKSNSKKTDISNEISSLTFKINSLKENF